MTRQLPASTRIAVVAATFGVALGFGINVWATIPDAGGVIHGCYKPENGQLRIVEGDAACGPSETAIQWNATGIQGPQGPQGPIGPQGPQGAPGDDSTRTAGGLIRPDGTTTQTTTDFVSRKVGAGHYQVDIAPGIFDTAPTFVVMPLGNRFIAGGFVLALPGGAWRLEWVIVNPETSTFDDAAMTFIATPFSN
jgi:hypothetical protein